MEWNKFKVRCSAINKIMANSRSNPVLTEKQAERLKDLESKSSLTANQMMEVGELLTKKANSSKVILSDTCIGYLMEVYAWETGRRIRVSKEMDIEYLQKGRLVEQDSIELLSFVEDILYQKNTERISNDFLSGEPDIFSGEQIMAATKITDIKSIWDHPTFLCKLNTGVANGNTEQLQGYGDITGALDLEVANCLVNMPPIQVSDYKRRLMYKMEVATDENPEFVAAWEVMLRSMIFDNIPANQRVHKIKVEPFTDFERQAVYDRVKVCRDWLCIFDETYRKMNL